MGDLYGGESWTAIVFVTGILGGGAAWLAGRALAHTWRPIWHAAGYMLLLAAAVRFVHFALFEATLISLPSYVVDALYLISVGSLSWRVTRAGQIARQYFWLYQRTGLLAWQRRAEPAVKSRPAASVSG